MLVDDQSTTGVGGGVHHRGQRSGRTVLNACPGEAKAVNDNRATSKETVGRSVAPSCGRQGRSARQLVVECQ
jgi:hypothetical protein